MKWYLLPPALNNIFRMLPKIHFIKGLPTPIILHGNTIPINCIFMRFTNNISTFPKPPMTALESTVPSLSARLSEPANAPGEHSGTHMTKMRRDLPIEWAES
jgi:hypothetical protein